MIYRQMFSPSRDHYSTKRSTQNERPRYLLRTSAGRPHAG